MKNGPIIKPCGVPNSSRTDNGNVRNKKIIAPRPQSLVESVKNELNANHISNGLKGMKPPPPRKLPDRAQSMYLRSAVPSKISDLQKELNRKLSVKNKSMENISKPPQRTNSKVAPVITRLNKPKFGVNGIRRSESIAVINDTKTTPTKPVRNSKTGPVTKPRQPVRTKSDVDNRRAEKAPKRPPPPSFKEGGQEAAKQLMKEIKDRRSQISTTEQHAKPVKLRKPEVTRKRPPPPPPASKSTLSSVKSTVSSQCKNDDVLTFKNSQYSESSSRASVSPLEVQIPPTTDPVTVDVKPKSRQNSGKSVEEMPNYLVEVVTSSQIVKESDDNLNSFDSHINRDVSDGAVPKDKPKPQPKPPRTSKTRSNSSISKLSIPDDKVTFLRSFQPIRKLRQTDESTSLPPTSSASKDSGCGDSLHSPNNSIEDIDKTLMSLPHTNTNSMSIKSGSEKFSLNPNIYLPTPVSPIPDYSDSSDNESIASNVLDDFPESERQVAKVKRSDTVIYNDVGSKPKTDNEDPYQTPSSLPLKSRSQQFLSPNIVDSLPPTLAPPSPFSDVDSVFSDDSLELTVENSDDNSTVTGKRDFTADENEGSHSPMWSTASFDYFNHDSAVGTVCRCTKRASNCNRCKFKAEVDRSSVVSTDSGTKDESTGSNESGSNDRTKKSKPHLSHQSRNILDRKLQKDKVKGQVKTIQENIQKKSDNKQPPKPVRNHVKRPVKKPESEKKTEKPTKQKTVESKPKLKIVDQPDYDVPPTPQPFGSVKFDTISKLVEKGVIRELDESPPAFVPPPPPNSKSSTADRREMELVVNDVIRENRERKIYKDKMKSMEELEKINEVEVAGTQTLERRVRRKDKRPAPQPTQELQERYDESRRERRSSTSSSRRDSEERSTLPRRPSTHIGDYRPRDRFSYIDSAEAERMENENGLARYGGYFSGKRSLPYNINAIYSHNTPYNTSSLNRHAIKDKTCDHGLLRKDSNDRTGHRRAVSDNPGYSDDMFSLPSRFSNEQILRRYAGEAPSKPVKRSSSVLLAMKLFKPDSKPSMGGNLLKGLLRRRQYSLEHRA